MDYVRKPFQFEEVNARVETHLRLRKLQSELELANRQLEVRNVALESERAKAKSLLRNILPKKVIVDLEKTGQSEPETFLEVTVLLTDFVGFTKQADVNRLSCPRQMMAGTFPLGHGKLLARFRQDQ